MNLSQIRGRIKNQLSYTPIPSQATNGYIDSIINDAYEEIWTQRPYTFNIKEIDQRYWPDFTPAATDTLDFSLGLREVAIDFTLPEGTPEENRARFIGAALEDPNGINYIIENIVESTGIEYFILDRPYEGATASNSSSYFIRQKFHYLPTDLIEIEDITFPNYPINHGHRGKVSSIPRRTAGSVSFNWLNTGERPNYYTPYSKEHIDIIPQGLTLLPNPGVGLVDDTYYFAVSVIDHTGAESGMTEVKGITTSGAASIRVALSTSVLYTDEAAKFRFKIYYALQRPDQDGFKFYEIGTINELDTSFITAITFDADYLRGIKAGNYQDKVWKQTTGSKKIQFYPRPNTADKSLTVGGGTRVLSFFKVRYMAKPAPLVDDYDTPAIPSSFHSLIVDRALADAHSKFGNESASLTSMKKFEEGLKRLNARFASERDSLLVRGQSMAYGRRFGRGLFPYVPTITYEG
jgi:hypothetical protein